MPCRTFTPRVLWKALLKAHSKQSSASIPLARRLGGRAGVAQMAEQPPCKRQVTGSIPVPGSGSHGPASQAEGRGFEARRPLRAL